MSQPQVDPEELAEQFGYKRGYQECQSELSFKIKAILADYLHTHKYTCFQMATLIGEILDSK